MAEGALHRLCAHCGSLGEPRLGYCSECGQQVCGRCGNVQVIRGERRPMHDACLKRGGDSGFSMIKFIK